MGYLSFRQGDKTDLEKVIAMAEGLDMDQVHGDRKRCVCISS